MPSLQNQIFTRRNKRTDETRMEDRKRRKEGRWGMRHVSEGRSEALEWGDRRRWRRGGGVSNLRGEMNGKWSCRETGEENVMRRWLGGGKKTGDRCRGMREEARMNHMREAPSSLPFLFLFFFLHSDSIFLRIFSHTFFSSFSFHTGTCVQKIPLNSSIYNTKKHRQTHTFMHKTRTHTGEWMSWKESLSLQQLPVHSYHYNNSEWH